MGDRNKAKVHPAERRKALFEALEPRILLSADPLLLGLLDASREDTMPAALQGLLDLEAPEPIATQAEAKVDAGASSLEGWSEGWQEASQPTSELYGWDLQDDSPAAPATLTEGVGTTVSGTVAQPIDRVSEPAATASPVAPDSAPVETEAAAVAPSVSTTGGAVIAHTTPVDSHTTSTSVPYPNNVPPMQSNVSETASARGPPAETTTAASADSVNLLLFIDDDLSAASPSQGEIAGQIDDSLDFSPFIDEIVRRLSDAGLLPDNLDLTELDVRVGDLDGRIVAIVDGSTIWLDIDAAGLGWFVDPTPSGDDEFVDGSSDAHLVAAPGGAAEGRVDLFDTLLHAVARVLGREVGSASAEPLGSSPMQALAVLAGHRWRPATGGSQDDGPGSDDDSDDTDQDTGSDDDESSPDSLTNPTLEELAELARDILDAVVAGVRGALESPPSPTGTHTGSTSPNTLQHSAAGWTPGAFIGGRVLNLTDGSQGLITANTSQSVTAVLAGGTENDWDAGDAYRIDMPTGSHTGVTSATLEHPNAGWTVGAFIGGTVRNLTDGSQGLITANTSHSVTAVLAGGTENDWDNGDTYRIDIGMPAFLKRLSDILPGIDADDVLDALDTIALVRKIFNQLFLQPKITAPYSASPNNSAAHLLLKLGSSTPVLVTVPIGSGNAAALTTAFQAAGLDSTFLAGTDVDKLTIESILQDGDRTLALGIERLTAADSHLLVNGRPNVTTGPLELTLQVQRVGDPQPPLATYTLKIGKNAPVVATDPPAWYGDNVTLADLAADLNLTLQHERIHDIFAVVDDGKLSLMSIGPDVADITISGADSIGFTTLPQTSVADPGAVELGFVSKRVSGGTTFEVPTGEDKVKGLLNALGKLLTGDLSYNGAAYDGSTYTFDVALDHVFFTGDIQFDFDKGFDLGALLGTLEISTQADLTLTLSGSLDMRVGIATTSSQTPTGTTSLSELNNGEGVEIRAGQVASVEVPASGELNTNAVFSVQLGYQNGDTDSKPFLLYLEAPPNTDQPETRGNVSAQWLINDLNRLFAQEGWGNKIQADLYTNAAGKAFVMIRALEPNVSRLTVTNPNGALGFASPLPFYDLHIEETTQARLDAGTGPLQSWDVDLDMNVLPNTTMTIDDVLSRINSGTQGQIVATLEGDHIKLALLNVTSDSFPVVSLGVTPTLEVGTEVRSGIASVAALDLNLIGIGKPAGVGQPKGYLEGGPLYDFDFADQIFIVVDDDHTPTLELEATIQETDPANPVRMSAALGSLGFLIESVPIAGEDLKISAKLAAELQDPGTGTSDEKAFLREMIDHPTRIIGSVTWAHSGQAKFKVSASEATTDVLGQAPPTLELELAFGGEGKFEFSALGNFVDFLKSFKGFDVTHAIDFISNFFDNLSTSGAKFLNDPLPIVNASLSDALSLVNNFTKAVQSVVSGLDVDALKTAISTVENAVSNLVLPLESREKLFRAVEGLRGALSAESTDLVIIGRRVSRLIASLFEFERLLKDMPSPVGNPVVGRQHLDDVLGELEKLIPNLNDFTERIGDRIETALQDLFHLDESELDFSLSLVDFTSNNVAQKAFVADLTMKSDNLVTLQELKPDALFPPDLLPDNIPISLAFTGGYTLAIGGEIKIKFGTTLGDAPSFFVIPAGTHVQLNAGFVGNLEAQVRFGSFTPVKLQVGLSLLRSDYKMVPNASGTTVNVPLDGTPRDNNKNLVVVAVTPQSTNQAILLNASQFSLSGTTVTIPNFSAYQNAKVEVEYQTAAPPLPENLAVADRALLTLDFSPLASLSTATNDLPSGAISIGTAFNNFSQTTLTGSGLIVATLRPTTGTPPDPISIVASLRYPTPRPYIQDNFLGGFLQNVSFDAISIIKGIRGFLDLLESGLESDVLRKIPMIGDKLDLSGKHVNTFIKRFKTHLLDPLEIIIKTAQDIETTIEGYILANLGVTATVTLDTAGSNPYFEIRFDAIGSDSLTVDFDAGFNWMKLVGAQASGSVTLTLGYDVFFGVGIDKEKGFYVVTKPNGDAEFALNVAAEVAPGTSFNADMFGLKIGVTANPPANQNDPSPTRVAGLLQLDIDTTTGTRRYVAEMKKVKFGTFFHPSATIMGGFDLRINANVNANLPSLRTDLTFGATATVTELGVSLSVQSVQFKHFGIHLGDFLDRHLRPALVKIDQYLAPLKPIIDLLNTEVPEVSRLVGYRFTLLNVLASNNRESAAKAQKFIDALAGISKLVKSIQDGAANDHTTFVELADTIPVTVGQTATPGTPTGTVPPTPSKFGSLLQEIQGLGINLQILQPQQLVKMFLGQPYDILRWDLPKFRISFKAGVSIQAPLPIPITASLKFAMEFFANFSIGFDSRGLKKDRSFIDGFYFGDLDASGVDVPELGINVTAPLSVGIGVTGISAGAYGGITASGTANWRDLDKDGKLYLDEIAAVAARDGIACIFDLKADLRAIGGLYGEVLTFRKEYELLNRVIAHIEHKCDNLTPAHVVKTTQLLANDAGAPDELLTNEILEPADQLVRDILASSNSTEADIPTDGMLVLHAGVVHDLRRPGATDDTNDTFVVEQLAPNVMKVTAFGVSTTYSGVQSIFFHGGRGQEDDVTFVGLSPDIQVKLYDNGEDISVWQKELWSNVRKIVDLKRAIDDVPAFEGRSILQFLEEKLPGVAGDALAKVADFVDFLERLDNRMYTRPEITAPEAPDSPISVPAHLLVSLGDDAPVEITVPALSDATVLQGLLNTAFGGTGIVTASTNASGQLVLLSADRDRKPSLAIGTERLAASTAVPFGQLSELTSFVVKVTRVADTSDPTGTETEEYEFELGKDAPVTEDDPAVFTADNVSAADLAADLNLLFNSANLLDVLATADANGKLALMGLGPEVISIVLRVSSTDPLGVTRLGFEDVVSTPDPGALELGFVAARAFGQPDYDSFLTMLAKLGEALGTDVLPIPTNATYDSAQRTYFFDFDFVKSFETTINLDFEKGIDIGDSGIFPKLEISSQAEFKLSFDAELDLRMGLSIAKADFTLGDGMTLSELNGGDGIPLLVGMRASAPVVHPQFMNNSLSFDLAIERADSQMNVIKSLTLAATATSTNETVQDVVGDLNRLFEQNLIHTLVEAKLYSHDNENTPEERIVIVAIDPTVIKLQLTGTDTTQLGFTSVSDRTSHFADLEIVAVVNDVPHVVPIDLDGARTIGAVKQKIYDQSRVPLALNGQAAPAARAVNVEIHDKGGLLVTLVSGDTLQIRAASIPLREKTAGGVKTTLEVLSSSTADALGILAETNTKDAVRGDSLHGQTLLDRFFIVDDAQTPPELRLTAALETANYQDNQDVSLSAALGPLGLTLTATPFRIEVTSAIRLDDPGVTDDGKITAREIVNNPRGSFDLSGLIPTIALLPSGNLVLSLSAEIIKENGNGGDFLADMFDGSSAPLVELIVSVASGPPPSIKFEAHTHFDELISQLKKLSIADVLNLAKGLVDKLREDDSSFFNKPLPLVGKSLNDILGFVDKLNDAVDKLISSVDLEVVVPILDEIEAAVSTISLPETDTLRRQLLGAIEAVRKALGPVPPSGSHEGGDGSATLEDADAGWTPGAFVGGTLLNLTDKSQGLITSNDADSIVATLAGGTDNDWDTGDSYRIDNSPAPDARRPARLLAAAREMGRLATSVPATVDQIAVQGRQELLDAVKKLLKQLPSFNSIEDRIESAIETAIGDALDLAPGEIDFRLGFVPYGTGTGRALMVGLRIDKDNLVSPAGPNKFSFTPEFSQEFGPLHFDTTGTFDLYVGAHISLGVGIPLNAPGDIFVVVNPEGTNPDVVKTQFDISVGFVGGLSSKLAFRSFDLVEAKASLGLVKAERQPFTGPSNLDQSFPELSLDHTPFESDERFIVVALVFDDPDGAGPLLPPADPKLLHPENYKLENNKVTIENWNGITPFPGGSFTSKLIVEYQRELPTDPSVLTDPLKRASLHYDLTPLRSGTPIGLGEVPLSTVANNFRKGNLVTNGLLLGSVNPSFLGNQAEHAITLAASMAHIPNYELTFDETALDQLFSNVKFDLTTILIAIEELLELIEDGLTSEILTKLPLIGKGLNLAGSFIGDLRDQFVTPLRELFQKVGGTYAEMDTFITNLILEKLGPAGLEILKDRDNDNDVDALDVVVELNDERFEILVSIGGGDKFLIDFSSGLAGLPIDATGSGGVVLALDYGIDFGVGVDKEKGFYFATNNNADPEFEFSIGASLIVEDVPVTQYPTGKKPTTIAVDLFGLELSATDMLTNGKGSFVKGGIYLDVTAPSDNRLYLSEIGKMKFSEVFEPYADLNTKIDLELEAAISEKLPSVSVELHVSWKVEIRFVGGEITISNPGLQAEFKNLAIDVGDFLQQQIGKTLDEFLELIKPIKPVIDALSAKVPGVSELSEAAGKGEVTFLDLALAKKPDAAKNAKKFISIVKGVFEVAESISRLRTDNPGANTKVVLIPSIQLVDVDRPAPTTLPPSGTAQENPNFIENILARLKEIGITLEFLDSAQIVNMFLGKTFNILSWDIPRLDLDFTWEKKFRAIPVPPISIGVGLDFGVFVDLSIGFDSRGIKTGNFLDGLYFGDRKNVSTGADIDELGLTAGVRLSAELDVVVASAGVEGELRGSILANWRDTDNDGKLYLDELKKIIKNDGLDCVFDIRGELRAIVSVIWSIAGKDGSKEFINKVIFEFMNECPHFQLGHVTIAGEDPPEALPGGPDAVATEGTLVLHAGSFAGQRRNGQTFDVAEDFKLVQLAPGVFEVKALGLERRYSGVKKIFFDGGNFDDTLDITWLGGHDVKVTALGGVGKDTLEGGKLEDYIDGGANDDTIDSFEGIDTLYGGAGKDTIMSGAGNDKVYGGEGNDRIYGGDGDDILDGDAGDDRIFGDAGSDVIHAGTGRDFVLGADGIDFIFGGSGADFLAGGGGADEIDGDAGHDLMVGDDAVDATAGNSHLETLLLANYNGSFPESELFPTDETIIDHLKDHSGPLNPLGAPDVMWAGDGNDLLLGQGGADTVRGGWGNDVLIAHEIMNEIAETADLLVGGPDNDFICGSSGNNLIIGGTDEESLIRVLATQPGPPGSGGYKLESCEEAPVFVPSTLAAPSIAGTKFRDADGDRIFDTNEAGIQSYTIELYDVDGQLVMSALTDANGRYIFTGLEPGKYTVSEAAQPGFTQTFPVSGSYTLTVDNGDAVIGRDFGNIDAGNYVFHFFRYFGDTDADRDVEDDDRLRFDESFLTTPSTNPDFRDELDYARDGDVDHVDLFRFSENYGRRLREPEGGAVNGVSPLAIGDAPVVTQATFIANDVPHTLSFTFSEPVTLTIADLELLNLSTGRLVDPGDMSFTYLNNVATWSFPELFAQNLADGNYRATLLVDNIRDAQGNALLGNEGLPPPPTGNLLPSVAAPNAPGSPTVEPGAPALGFAQVSGSKWNDIDGDGTLDPAEPALGGITIFADYDGDGQLDNAEPRVVTENDGSYVLTDLVPGTYYIREVLPPGQFATFPAATLFYSNGFESAVGGEWSSTTVSTTPSGRGYLGDFGTETVQLALAALPHHTGVRIEADLFAIGGWDGDDASPFGPDSFSFGEPGEAALVDATFSNGTGTQSYPGPAQAATTGAGEVGTLGFGQDSVYHFDVTFAHTDSLLELDFMAAIAGSGGGSDYVHQQPDSYRLFGDLDGDRDVDAVDRGAFQIAFLHTSGQAAYDVRCDGDDDGDIDNLDLYRFASNFGETLAPAPDLGLTQHTPSSGAPTVVSIDFDPQDVVPHRIVVTFSEDVSASLDVADLIVTNLTTGQTIATSAMSLDNPGGTVATWSFVDPGVAHGLIPDGNYRITVKSSGVSDASGHALVGNADVADEAWGLDNVRILLLGAGHQVTVPAGRVVADLDFGNTPPVGRITGLKWNDLDTDGVFDGPPLEQVVKNWTIFLDANGDGILNGGERSTVTGDDGKYEFNGLAPGMYLVTEVIPGDWVQSFPRGPSPIRVRIDGFQTVANINFGNFMPIPLDDGDDVAHGEGGSDTIHGDNLVANPRVISTGGADKLFGGEGEDDIFGQEEDDQLSGGFEGNSQVVDELDGGVGTDTVFAEENENMILEAGILRIDPNGAAENDSLDRIERGHLIGGSGVNRLDASAFPGPVRLEGEGEDNAGVGDNDVLIGGAHDDVLNGGPGSDDLLGGDGNDLYVFTKDVAAGEADEITESTGVMGGVDELDFSAISLLGVSVDLGNSSPQPIHTGRTLDLSDLSGALVIENLTGGSSLNTDVLTGNALDNVIVGGKGDDRIEGGNGDDTYVFAAGDGFDTLFDVDGAHDRLDYSALTASLRFDIGVSTLNVYDGATPLATHAGIAFEHLVSGTGNDEFRFIADGAVLAAAGQGTIDAGAGADWLRYLFTTAAGAIVDLGQGTATGTLFVSSIANVQGGDGNDDLEGDNFANVLIGGAGNDQLRGLGGADTLEGGGGSDGLVGGDGDDRYVFKAVIGSETDFLADSSGRDTLDLTAITENITLDLSVSAGSMGGHGARTITALGGAQIEVFRGGSGNDTVTDNAASNLLVGGDGNDRYKFTNTGGGQIDQIEEHELVGENPPQGNDTLDFSAVTEDLDVDLSLLELESKIATQGTSSRFVWIAGPGMPFSLENITGGSGDDELKGTGAANVLDGGPGNDELVGLGDDDLLLGGPGNDNLFGDDDDEPGNDELFGPVGNDVLDPGTGSIENLVGGDGHDVYLFRDVSGSPDVTIDESGGYVAIGTGKASKGGRDTLDFRQVSTPVTLDLSSPADSQPVYGNLDLFLPDEPGKPKNHIEIVYGSLTATNNLVGNDVDNVLWGGSQNDTLEGGGGSDLLVGFAGADVLLGYKNTGLATFPDPDNDILLGGDGADTLRGSGGRDLLIGGADEDTFSDPTPDPNHGVGDDILISGSTAYDDVLADAGQALFALRLEWISEPLPGSSPTPVEQLYKQRIFRLQDLGIGEDNSIHLRPDTVTGDGVNESLIGGAGLDWFFLAAAGDTSDRVNPELAVTLGMRFTDDRAQAPKDRADGDAKTRGHEQPQRTAVDDPFAPPDAGSRTVVNASETPDLARTVVVASETPDPREEQPRDLDFRRQRIQQIHDVGFVGQRDLLASAFAARSWREPEAEGGFVFRAHREQSRLMRSLFRITTIDNTTLTLSYEFSERGREHDHAEDE